MRWTFGTDGDSLSYWRTSAELRGSTVEDRLAAHGIELPQPLPDNRDAWRAFVLVYHMRHAPMGQPTLPIWTDVAVVLQLHGLWNEDVQRRLQTCFLELLTLDSEQRKAKHG